MKFVTSIGFVLLFTFGKIFPQELISNGDFENYNAKLLLADNNIIGLKNWKYFAQPRIITYREISTVDYYIDNNEANPKHGRYVLELESGLYKRDYIYYQFTTPLQKGKYILSFDISKQECDTFFNKLEYLFAKKIPNCKREIVKNGHISYLSVKNGFMINHPKYMNTLMPFVHIETVYEAHGDEKYLVFGNFNSTKKNNINSLDTWNNRYFLDNISLMPLINGVRVNKKIIPDTNNIKEQYNIDEPVENLDCYLYSDTVFGGPDAASLYSKYYSSKKNQCLAKLRPFLKSLLLSNNLSIEITVNKMLNGMNHEIMAVWIQNEIASYFEYYGISPDRIILKSYPHFDKKNELEIYLKLVNSNFKNHKK